MATESLLKNSFILDKTASEKVRKILNKKAPTSSSICSKDYSSNIKYIHKNEEKALQRILSHYGK